MDVRRGHRALRRRDRERRRGRPIRELRRLPGGCARADVDGGHDHRTTPPPNSSAVKKRRHFPFRSDFGRTLAETESVTVFAACDGRRIMRGHGPQHTFACHRRRNPTGRRQTHSPFGCPSGDGPCRLRLGPHQGLRADRPGDARGHLRRPAARPAPRRPSHRQLRERADDGEIAGVEERRGLQGRAGARGRPEGGAVRGGVPREQPRAGLRGCRAPRARCAS